MPCMELLFFCIDLIFLVLSFGITISVFPLVSLDNMFKLTGTHLFIRFVKQVKNSCLKTEVSFWKSSLIIQHLYLVIMESSTSIFTVSHCWKKSLRFYFRILRNWLFLEEDSTSFIHSSNYFWFYSFHIFSFLNFLTINDKFS